MEITFLGLIQNVSIPNGMEFYVRNKNVYFGVSSFQFPTGWNSTLPAWKFYESIAVSIPNGMEFYSSPLNF